VLGSSQILGEGSPVYVAGFPAGTAAITRSVYTFTEGTITARSSKPFSDGYAMVYSNNTLPGMSGGGVFNQVGQLVGIHGRGDVDNQLETSAINPGIVIKTGFNLGIPIETLVERGEAVGLKLAITPSTRPISVNPGDDRVVAATIKAQQGDYNGAIADISRAIAQSPKAANLYFARANYAISIDPQNPWRYWERGLENSYSKTAKRDFEKAKELFRLRGSLEQVQQCETFINGIECDLKGTSCKK
jgi:tetratricopeptide (TPR) repeat protein